MKKVAGRGLAAFMGIAVAAVFITVLGASGGEDTRSITSPRPATSSAPGPGATPSGEPSETPSPQAPDRNSFFLAWAPGSLPTGTESAIETMGQVRSATTVLAGLDWIESWRLPGGGSSMRPPRGYEIPFEIAVVEPREYSHFADRDDRRAVERLRPGRALLAATSKRLRGGGRGLRLDLGERSLRVTGTVSDQTTNGYEAIVAGPAPPEWARADRFVLAHLDRPGAGVVVERRIEAMLPAGQPLQTRAEGENPFLRYGDAVLPQMLIKDVFGEFAANPLPDGSLDIEQSWERRNIRTERVPLLGDVKCHRVLFPQLRAAIRDLQRQGLAHAIHPEEFEGCYVPRFINRDPEGRLSHHSWGAAVDLNAEENGFGTKADLDMRVVEIFEDRWGFTWGGRWVVPDGMHFEWIKFP